MTDDFITAILSAPAIVALVADRVTPGKMTQGAPRPAIVVNKISGAPEYADDGEIGIEASRVQVDCWGDTYTDAKLLSRLVRAEFSAFCGVVGSTDFRFVMLDDERDLAEGGTNAAKYPTRVSLDFIAWHRAA
jgi:hypothetical protein